MQQDAQDAPFAARDAIERLNRKAAQDAPMTIEDLALLMRVLRDPYHGCPWDREQSFATIAPYTIEEAYEVADAIARGEIGDLRDELGDLLLQVVYHAQMASEARAFDFEGVADAICRKMIRRHPHVFGGEEVRASIEVKGLWDRVKAEEQAAKTSSASARAAPASLLDDVPVALPALTRAVKLQKRAAKIGFDWTETAQIFDKLKEELAEFEAELGQGDKARIEDEFGDLMFVLANLARRMSIDPETALRGANAKFERRFRHIETRLAELGRALGEAALNEMDALWNEAKALERAASRASQGKAG